ncbi:MAG TPA: 4-hydroxythreonine-4-phosphate dehydrogenase PdxA [Casimicrobiaceae bacterium]|nr:4-hydroxythreonine-4-phosphate dehydrogenase PdxA [Casimicrobiaceae bacterium]
MSDRRPAIAITVGEPAGIGPDICAMLAARHAIQPFPARLVLIGDRDLLRARARRIGLSPRFVDFDSWRFAANVVEVWHVPVSAPVDPGRPDAANANAVVTMLERASDACATGVMDAIVTAPVQKSAILDAGIDFTGHTEFFAQRTSTPRVVMMLVGGEQSALRIALVTTHLALRDVPGAITRDAVTATIQIVDRALREQFAIESPRIGVCGLNPHAGEGGHLGDEDVEVIAPAIERCRSEGIDARGPTPADTIFVPRHARSLDAIIAMYHDQGLPTLKAASFGGGVNVTLGLPFVRTSVDHGTALDLARDAESAATADPGSLVAALTLAIELARTAMRGR